MTLNMFDKLKKTTNGTVTKIEFQKWCVTTLESLEGQDFENIFDTFCTGGPIVEEEEPDDGIPRLMSATEAVTTGKKINKSPEKKPMFIPLDGTILPSSPAVAQTEVSDLANSPFAYTYRCSLIGGGEGSRSREARGSRP